MKKTYKNAIYLHIAIICIIIIIHKFVNSELVNCVPKCFFYEKYNFICPSCGGTRFITELCNLNIEKAFNIHPVFFMIFVYVIILDITYVFNVICNKKVKIFRYWHVTGWGFLILIYTIIRNII